MAHEFKVRKRAPHRIEIFVDQIEQLFNSMDPSPFHERDLDHDAEEFIVSWAREFSANAPFVLIVHLNGPLERNMSPEMIEEAVRNYFAYPCEAESAGIQAAAQTGAHQFDHRVAVSCGLSLS